MVKVGIMLLVILLDKIKFRDDLKLWCVNILVCI